ncbi:hypothetical protein PQJ75_19905 [Rhodoplanes sp. TEM]|uniref:Uncharacterized protein n=1 Tax=Rhodoplanes tepidamans TaxID=200616 RepID=A0ABT5JBP4_RHOTP|nr:MULTISPECIES: hypothetical protein [Rhodoplanes]MDC7786801.1 hypothetical protein [Rhodoplanes tepidamans]MDC7985999.1 hypothetical protein [Rhodoplanes sp. TEM]MDQ0355928.1 hypothetical protein [Rhodoplanes tepidamans]
MITTRSGQGGAVMRRVLLAAGLLVVGGDPLAAQAGCGEGRTGSGVCVDATLAETARQAAIVFAQPKISQAAFPVLPVLDLRWRYPHQLLPDQLGPAPTGTPLPPPPPPPIP